MSFHFCFFFYSVLPFPRYIRILIQTGPLVTMMGKMVKNMIYFVVLLLVVLLSFGVSRQSILYPDQEASWGLIREVSGVTFRLIITINDDRNSVMDLFSSSFLPFFPFCNVLLCFLFFLFVITGVFPAIFHVVW